MHRPVETRKEHAEIRRGSVRSRVVADTVEHGLQGIRLPTNRAGVRWCQRRERLQVRVKIGRKFLLRKFVPMICVVYAAMLTHLRFPPRKVKRSAANPYLTIGKR